MNDVKQHLLSGGLSGFASTVCLQPLDLLKTRIQQRDGSMAGPRIKSSIPDITREIIKVEGVRGLWRGTTPTLLRNIPGVAFYFTGLSYTRSLLATTHYFSVSPISVQQQSSKAGSVLPKLTNQGNLLAGAAARVAVGVILNPFTLLKARYESNMYAYHSIPSALASLVRGGPTELFRGVIASSLRDAPYAGLFVVCYEHIKADLSTFLAPASSTVSTGIHSFSAASAGVIATLATHPFDVVKTKMQVRSEEQYQGLFRTVATVWQQRGISGFFDGAALRVSRKPLSSAIAWAVYEGMLMFMRT